MPKVVKTLRVQENQKPLIIYYCKANLKNGNTVRVVDRNVSPQEVIDCKGVELIDVKKATMVHDNSTGKARASGAKCVLEVFDGMINILQID